MKRNVFLSLLLAGLLALAGCGQNGGSQEESGDLLSRIKDRGELVVAMEGTWAPWTYHDESDALAGYDVEVSAAGCLGPLRGGGVRRPAGRPGGRAVRHHGQRRGH